MSSLGLTTQKDLYAGCQMEKENRKRQAMAPKQHVNKRGRAEKPAVTQGRRSKFTAMSAQTVTSDDEDAAPFQRQKYVNRNIDISIHDVSALSSSDKC